MTVNDLDIGQLDFSSITETKQFIADYDKLLCAQFFEVSIEELQRLRSALFDKILQQLWQFYRLDQFALSLNAVGGYGRGVLHPQSDIDLCILFAAPLSQEAESALSLFLTRLWDLSVDVGHAVRSLEENTQAAQSDITIATNLLDIRTLAGTEEHAVEVQNHLYNNLLWTSKSFFEHKYNEQIERHKKARNTALYLEPNVKNNPGGLRDVQTIIWIARKHFNVDNAQALRSKGFLRFDEYIELRESYDFLCRIRWALHAVSNRAEERLLFEYQLDVAEFMKFGHGDNAQLAVEKMMRQLFRAMTRIREISQMLCDVFRREILQTKAPKQVVQIDEHFSICDDMIQANYDEVFYDKSNVMRLFRLIAENGCIKSISPETIRLVRQTRRGLLGELQDYHGCRKEFLKIVEHPNGLKLAFSYMHRYGILASYFPQWRAIEGQMQFDMHNAYTVDEHAFKLIQHLDAFASAGQKARLVESLYQQSQLKKIIVFAGLCHDLSGKQSHESNDISAIYAREFATLHQLRKSEIDLVVWIIEKQDLLISAIQTQDIQDPEVISKLARIVRTEAKLNALFCFTVADIKATNDQMWNEWQESLLNELYFSLRTTLKRGTENVFESRTAIRESKLDAMQLLINQQVEENNIVSFWSLLPSSFFIENYPAEIADFTHNILQNGIEGQVVSLTLDKQSSCNNLLVYANDRSMLFVDLFNTLLSLKIKVKSAKIMKTKQGKVLEVIKILDQNDEVIQDEYRIGNIGKSIREVINNEKAIRKPTKPRYVDNFEQKPTIEFLTTPKKDKTLLRINTLDDPKFIERICQVFKHNELIIHSAKMSTLGECSENAFLVSTKDQSAVSHQEQAHLEEALVSRMQ